MHRLPLAPLLAVSGLLIGCGGGGDGPVTVALTSTPLLDGSVSARGNVVGLFGAIAVGDNTFMGSPDGGLRGFVAFDLAGIPADATVTRATLTLMQFEVRQTPYSTLGLLLVDQVVYGSVLEAGAYDRAFPSSQGFGVLSTDAVLGPKTLDVTTQVQADLAASRTQSQLRLRFAVEEDFDSHADVAVFYSADTGPTPADRPTLVVTYEP